jgi:Leucine-rich repeat (LRR) protein
MISQTSKSQLTELRLANTKFSIDCTWFQHLESIDLGGCGLDSIPKELQQTARLRTLQLENNCIEDLSVLVAWPKLRQLGLARNRLKSVFHVRDVIEKLPCLAILDVRYDHFT